MDKDTLYYDGACPLCSAEIDRLCKFAGDRLVVRDIHALDEHGNLPDRQRLLARLHLRTADGEWLTGLRANIRAWEHTPSRLDPIVGAMELLIKSERYLYAVTLGETASRLANPSVAYTNVDMADYKYWFPEMYSFAVYKLGSPQVAFSVVEKALEQMEEGEYGYDKLLARRDQYKKECES